MKTLSNPITYLLVFLTVGTGTLSANQTTDLSPIFPETTLPFRVQIEKANFELPEGLHSGVVGTFKGKWILIAGRTNGLHGFGADPFPPAFQNTNIYVVDPATGMTISRSLTEPGSGLNQQQIDSISVVSPQGFQDGNTLYMTGGYGIDTATGTYGTKPVLTAFYLPGIVEWVTRTGNNSQSVIKNIRQIMNPAFQITGGEMYKSGDVIQLIFGQNFTGVYNDCRNGVYSEQVRRFRLNDNKDQLSVDILPSKPSIPDPNFRRRDLNILPVMLNNNSRLRPGFVAYGGVFTEDTGVWTLPVVINESGDPTMADPASPSSFKQGMNQYVSAAAGLYSRKHMSMYNIFFGGISYGFYSGGVFETDSEIPFINQVTTIKMDKDGHFTQYLMNNQYPVIQSTQTNPGNTLLFGAGAYFIPNNLLHYPNNVISLDAIRKPTVIGYITGGIASTVPNTSTDADSSGSPYVFKVTLTPV